MNMVGTPCSAVQRSSATARSVASGSKASPGKTMHAPVAAQASTDITMPKQWYSGTGTHRRSVPCRFIAMATKRALLTMLTWVSVAPLGAPVVPLVNWMLIASSGDSAAVMASSVPAGTPCPRAITSSKRIMPGVAPSPIRMTQRSAGSFAARRAPGCAVASSGASVCSISR